MFLIFTIKKKLFFVQSDDPERVFLLCNISFNEKKKKTKFVIFDRGSRAHSYCKVKVAKVWRCKEDHVIPKWGKVLKFPCSLHRMGITWFEMQLLSISLQAYSRRFFKFINKLIEKLYIVSIDSLKWINSKAIYATANRFTILPMGPQFLIFERQSKQKLLLIVIFKFQLNYSFFFKIKI